VIYREHIYARPCARARPYGIYMASPPAEPPCAAVQAAAFALEGHPTAAFNGTYRPRGQHEGWPRFENEHGMHLFRLYGVAKIPPVQEWYLDSDFSPDESSCAGGMIAAAEGPIPTGAQQWTCPDDGVGWEERTVTVTALVSALRRCLPPHWALTHLDWRYRSYPISQKLCSGEVPPLQAATCAWLLGMISPVRGRRGSYGQAQLGILCVVAP
jgi:hypothetical protein